MSSCCHLQARSLGKPRAAGDFPSVLQDGCKTPPSSSLRKALQSQLYVLPTAFCFDRIAFHPISNAHMAAQSQFHLQNPRLLFGLQWRVEATKYINQKTLHGPGTSYAPSFSSPLLTRVKSFACPGNEEHLQTRRFV